MVLEQAKTSQQAERKVEKSYPARVRYSRTVYCLLAWVFVVCVVVQVFIAGMAIFDNPVNWVRHTVFVHVFEYVPIFMFVLGFLGRLPRRIVWGSLGLYALIFIQYATANGIVPALHPVIALGLFWGSLILARKSLQAVFG